jgi:hypothetical protein
VTVGEVITGLSSTGIPPQELPLYGIGILSSEFIGIALTIPVLLSQINSLHFYNMVIDMFPTLIVSFSFTVSCVAINGA